MNPRPDIVCLGQTSWDTEQATSLSPLLAELALQYRILYVDPLVGWADRLWQSSAAGQPGLRTRQTASGAEIHHLVIPSMVGTGSGWLQRWVRHRQQRAIDRACRQLGFDRPIVLTNAQPDRVLPLLERWPDMALLYWVDTVAGAVPPAPSEPMARLLTRARAVVVPTVAWLRFAQTWQPQTILTRPGLSRDFLAGWPDVHLRRSATDPSTPTVGYLGAIDRRLDYDLLVYCARQLTHVVFVLIGPIADQWRLHSLRTLPNVCIAGDQPQAHLPRLLQKLQAGLVPLLETDPAALPFPEQLYPYLSVGLPVVCTPGVDTYLPTGLAYPGDSPAAFCRAIEEALAETDPTLGDSRRQVAEAGRRPDHIRQLTQLIEQVRAKPA